VATGVRLDEVTYYSTVIYDEESYFDRRGSLLYGRQAVRTGVWLK
jgi:hypothetical protein